MASGLCLMTVSGVAIAEKKPRSTVQGNQQVAKISKDEKAKIDQSRTESITSMRTDLTLCRATFMSDMMELEGAVRSAIASKELDYLFEYKVANAVGPAMREQIRMETMNLKQKEGFKYQSCVTEAKTRMSDRTRGFVDTFTGEQKSNAKQMIGQWYTAIDAVSRDNFDNEASKFETMANTIKVEMAME